MQIDADICNTLNRDPIVSGEFISPITMFSLALLPNHLRTQPVLTEQPQVLLCSSLVIICKFTPCPPHTPFWSLLA